MPHATTVWLVDLGIGRRLPGRHAGPAHPGCEGEGGRLAAQHLVEPARLAVEHKPAGEGSMLREAGCSTTHQRSQLHQRGRHTWESAAHLPPKQALTCCRRSLRSGGRPSPWPSRPAVVGFGMTLLRVGRTQPPRSSRLQCGRVEGCRKGASCFTWKEAPVAKTGRVHARRVPQPGNCQLTAVERIEAGAARVAAEGDANENVAVGAAGGVGGGAKAACRHRAPAVVVGSTAQPLLTNA